MINKPMINTQTYDRSAYDRAPHQTYDEAFYQAYDHVYPAGVPLGGTARAGWLCYSLPLWAHYPVTSCNAGLYSIGRPASLPTCLSGHAYAFYPNTRPIIYYGYDQRFNLYSLRDLCDW
jgi:hypothetical protein